MHAFIHSVGPIKRSQTPLNVITYDGINSYANISPMGGTLTLLVG